MDDELKREQEIAYDSFLSKVANSNPGDLDVSDLNKIIDIYTTRVNDASDGHHKMHIESRRAAFMKLLQEFGISYSDGRDHHLLGPPLYMPPDELAEMAEKKNIPKFSPRKTRKKRNHRRRSKNVR